MVEGGESPGFSPENPGILKKALGRLFPKKFGTESIPPVQPIKTSEDQLPPEEAAEVLAIAQTLFDTFRTRSDVPKSVSFHTAAFANERIEKYVIGTGDEDDPKFELFHTMSLWGPKKERIENSGQKLTFSWRVPSRRIDQSFVDLSFTVTVSDDRKTLLRLDNYYGYTTDEKGERRKFATPEQLAKGARRLQEALPPEMARDIPVWKNTVLRVAETGPAGNMTIQALPSSDAETVFLAPVQLRMPKTESMGNIAQTFHGFVDIARGDVSLVLDMLRSNNAPLEHSEATGVFHIIKKMNREGSIADHQKTSLLGRGIQEITTPRGSVRIGDDPHMLDISIKPNEGTPLYFQIPRSLLPRERDNRQWSLYHVRNLFTTLLVWGVKPEAIHTFFQEAAKKNVQDVVVGEFLQKEQATTTKIRLPGEIILRHGGELPICSTTVDDTFDRRQRDREQGIDMNDTEVIIIRDKKGKVLAYYADQMVQAFVKHSSDIDLDKFYSAINKHALYPFEADLTVLSPEEMKNLKDVLGGSLSELLGTDNIREFQKPHLLEGETEEKPKALGPGSE